MDYKLLQYEVYFPSYSSPILLAFIRVLDHTSAISHGYFSQAVNHFERQVHQNYINRKLFKVYFCFTYAFIHLPVSLRHLGQKPSNDLSFHAEGAHATAFK